MGDGMSDGAICGWRDGHTCHLPVGHGGPCDNDSSVPAGEINGDDTFPDLPNCPTCGCPEAQEFTRVYLCGSVWSQDDGEGDRIEVRACGPVGEHVAALRAELEVVHEHNTKLVGENHVLRAEAKREANELHSWMHAIDERTAKAERRADAAEVEVERMRRWMERAINDGGIDHHFVDAYRAEQQETTERSPWGYRDRLALAALVWQDAQNDMTQDREEAHRALMREASDYRRREGLDG